MPHPKKTHPQTAQAENILVIKLGALGDFVQALGPMAAIRNHHPDAHITLLTTSPFVTFGRECGYFDDIMIDERPKWHQPRKWMALSKSLNSGNFTRVYDLQNNDRTSFYFGLIKSKPEWVGIAKGASHRNTSPDRTAGHAFDGHVQTLSLAGINNIEIDDMRWIKGDIDHFALTKPYILIVPGCAPSRPEKRWPAKNYADIARTIHGWGYQPVIIGTEAEKDIAHEICVTLPQAANLAGKTSLTDLVLLARSASAAIGNDTGPMHLIAPTGCPTYVIFSESSNPVKHAPKGKNITIIKGGDLNTLGKEDVMKYLHSKDFTCGKNSQA